MRRPEAMGSVRICPLIEAYFSTQQKITKQVSASTTQSTDGDTTTVWATPHSAGEEYVVVVVVVVVVVAVDVRKLLESHCAAVDGAQRPLTHATHSGETVAT